jgi:hypothetical protein
MIEPAKEIVASVQTLLRVYLRLQEDELETAGYCVPQGDINVAAENGGNHAVSAEGETDQFS